MGAEAQPEAAFASASQRLATAIREQMQLYGIHGISVALVDDQRIVYAAGFGTAKPDTVFRAGSISKVLNAVAMMQLVEQGRLDLDAPLSRYGAQFSFVSPFENASPVTLRQLLCHRSGLVRESPVGGYLDDSQPSLADTVASVRSCPLLNPPNTTTRYSNIGPSVAGQLLVTVAGVPYEQYQRERVLGPIGMHSSSFLLKDIPRERLSPSWMRITDGKGGYTSAETPVFDLGTLPAGNLYTTAEDLAKFLTCLAAEGRIGDKQLISPQTLAAMATVQLISGEAGFGLGFRVGKFREHKFLGHMGAVYGHTSSLAFLPGPKLGVILLSNEDIATGPISKLTNTALALLLQAQRAEPLPPPPTPVTLTASERAALAGEYESPSHWAKIEAHGDTLTANLSGQPLALTPLGPLTLQAEGRLLDAATLQFERDAEGQVSTFTAVNQKFRRVAANVAADAPPAWAEFIGSYGPAFIPVVISIRHGHLYALIENELDYRLIPASRNVFICPPGMYREEHLVFMAEPHGRVHGVSIANMYLPRRPR